MSDIRLIQMNNYVRPKLVENKAKNWVLNGVGNSFYQYIIDRYNGSPTNAAIINSYTQLIYGKGLSYKNSNLKEWVKVRSILQDRELKKIIADFELFGEASFQVIKAKNKKDLSAIYHIAKEKVVPSLEDEDGEIESYWYSKDFKNLSRNPAEEFSAFGTSKDEIEIYCIKPYSAGKNYFSDPDYIAGLPYAEMEEEIANYYISHIKNGLSFGYIINIPDGKSLTPEEKDEIEKRIKQKLTGSSNAGKFVLSFNGRDAEITVTPIVVNDAHKQWTYLTSESRQQLMTAHRVVSPMLFGIKDSTGLGNNADELKTAEELMMKMVIQPKQQYILDALEEVFAFYNINIELYFRPLTETAQAVEMSADEKKNDALESFIALGEDEPTDDYDLIDENEVDYEEEERFFQLATTGTANPNAKSEQDGKYFIVRYKYTGNAKPEREFCKKMMDSGKIYRKEDIIAMDSQPVNKGFGMDGADTYSIWLYKGGGLLSDTFPGGTCRHKWNRVIYLKKGVNIDVNSPLAEIISTSEARRRGFKIPANDNLVSIAPHENR